MPLLLCPNDNGSMQTVHRAGVEFDVCPTCRGVWLDRGELEKLMAVAHEAGPHNQPSQERPTRTEFEPRGRDDDDFRRKKRRSSIFDIFE